MNASLSREPRVSVIMTCYNEGSYITAAVESVLCQSRADLIDNILIADDGSDQPTLEVLRSLEERDSRIEILYGPGGGGISERRNAALKRSRSECFAILDGDDFWTFDKLEKQMHALTQDERIGLVYTDYFVFPGSEVALARRAGVGDLTNAKDLTLAYFLNDPPIIPSTILVRRKAFETAGAWDESVKVFEDTDLYVRLSRLCRFALVNEPTLYKRISPTSMTGRRKDLLAQHAHVAFKAADDEPRLLPFVPKRLAERARKLANYRFLVGEREGALLLLRLATRLDILNVKAWISLLAVDLFPGVAQVWIARFAKSRRDSFRSNLR